jgi:glycosyltransferase involved in cell wall biosynthesis
MNAWLSGSGDERRAVAPQPTSSAFWARRRPSPCLAGGVDAQAVEQGALTKWQPGAGVEVCAEAASPLEIERHQVAIGGHNRGSPRTIESKWPRAAIESERRLREALPMHKSGKPHISEPPHLDPAPSRRPRVVMLLENNPYPQDVRVRAEAESLTAAGYAVTVVAPRARVQPRRERVGRVRVTRFHALEGRGALGFVLEYLVAGAALHLAALREFLRGAAVLHIHNPPDVLFAAGALFRLCGRRVVFDHHDLFPETIEAKVGSRKLARLARACERFTFLVANHVLATNESYAEIARARGRKPSDRVTVVRNAPPDAWLKIPLSVRPRELNPVRIAYLGALSTQDGVEALPAILSLLEEHGVASRVTVVGDGDLRPQLEHDLARAGLRHWVDISGWVPWERVPALLQEADVCIDPAPRTKVNDVSTMIKVAEYLALGKPVVAFDLLETRRTAYDAALLIPPGDIEAFSESILNLARDPELRLRLARRARDRAADLAWSHSERALLGVYQRLVQT